jgi:hypothetical protein
MGKQLSNNSYKPITNATWVRARLCKLQKGCTRLAAASDKVYQLLAHGRWFSPGTPASSTTKTGRHEIAEILLKVALKHQKSIIHTSKHYEYVMKRNGENKKIKSDLGGRSRSTRREPPTMGKQLVNFVTCGCESSAPFFVIYKAGCKPTPYW